MKLVQALITCYNTKGYSLAVVFVPGVQLEYFAADSPETEWLLHVPECFGKNLHMNNSLSQQLVISCKFRCTFSLLMRQHQNSYLKSSSFVAFNNYHTLINRVSSSHFTAHQYFTGIYIGTGHR